jgi:DNA-binding NarL/FixJ family response regulator
MQTMRHTEVGEDPIGSLSDRELAVFEKIGQGQGTADIAESMNLSIKTVETYRSRIKTKLGVTGSTELLQRAVQWTLGKKA